MTPLAIAIAGGILFAIWLIVTDPDRTAQQKADDVALAVLLPAAVALDSEIVE